MSEEDRIKWDQRYADGSYQRKNPQTWLRQWLPRIPPGRALDVATGSGRNAFLLAERGYRVDAVDISAVGLELARQQAGLQGLDINWQQRDLELDDDFDSVYDVILVLWYVNLPLITKLCSGLKKGGYLICEEHLQTAQEVIGPRNPHYRVAPGALREAAAELQIISYEESITPLPDSEAVASARLVAMRP